MKKSNKSAEKDSKTLGLKLRYCRSTSKFTQLQIAELFKLDRSSISYYESEKAVPTITYLLNFSKEFKISLTDLADNNFAFEDFIYKYPCKYFAKN